MQKYKVQLTIGGKLGVTYCSYMYIVAIKNYVSYLQDLDSGCRQSWQEAERDGGSGRILGAISSGGHHATSRSPRPQRAHSLLPARLQTGPRGGTRWREGRALGEEREREPGWPNPVLAVYYSPAPFVVTPTVVLIGINNHLSK